MSTTSTSNRTRTNKIAVTNVRVFDGDRLGDPGTVVIDGGVIGIDPSGAEIIDANGATLIPGLIDAHVHLHGVETLEQLADYGVTTGLDMATWPPSLVDSLRNRRGLTDIRSAGIPASASGSAHSHVPDFPTQGLVDSPDAASQFVADRVSEGVDYIKVVADVPGPSQETLDALVTAAHQRDRFVVAHAVSTVAFGMGVSAGVDMLTHAPLDVPLDDSLIDTMLADKTVVIPTLTMMEGIAELAAGVGPDLGGNLAERGGPSYAAARSSVSALHRAGVPILAGTDANAALGVPFSPVHGESLHHELELLVDAGLSPAAALASATVLSARYFGLSDRGTIAPGQRADLVLIDGDPTLDIRHTRRIKRVWCGGIERTPAAMLN